MNKNLYIILLIALGASAVIAAPTPRKSKFSQFKQTVFSKKAGAFMPQTERFYTWDGSGSTWIPEDSTKFTWTPDGRLMMEETNGKERLLYIGDSAQNMYVAIKLLKNGSGNWDSVYREASWTDSHMNDTQFIRHNYDLPNHIWKENFRTRNVNGYNGSGLFATSTMYVFNADSNRFEPTEKMDMLYAAGKLSQLDFQYWDTTVKGFQSVYKYTTMTWHKWNSTFDNSLPVTYKMLYHLGGGVYAEAMRYTYAYDAHDEEIVVQEEQYDGSNYVLTNRDSSITTYDANNWLNEKITMTYDIGSGDYTNSYRITYSDFYMPTGIVAIRATAGNNMIYPNPATGSFRVDVPTGSSLHLELYDINGRRVLEQELTPSEPVVNALGLNGIYFYTLSSGKSVVKSGRIVLQ